MNKYLLSGLGALGLVVLLFYLHSKEVDDAFQSGYDKRDGELNKAWVASQNRVKELEAQNNTALAEHQKEVDSYEKQLAEAERRFKNVTPQVQKQHGVCNPVLGDISLLNSAKGYPIGSSENPSMDDQESRAPSSVTAEAIIRDSQQCASQYETLRGWYLELAGSVKRLKLVSGQP